MTFKREDAEDNKSLVETQVGKVLDPESTNELTLQRRWRNEAEYPPFSGLPEAPAALAEASIRRAEVFLDRCRKKIAES